MSWYEMMGEGYLESRRKWLYEMPEQRWMMQVLRELPKRDALTLADVGCSGGHAAKSFFAEPLGHRMRDIPVEYTGYDFTPEYLDLGREYFEGKENVKFVELDIQRELGDRHDVVICNAVMEHCVLYDLAIPNLLAMTRHMLLWRSFLGDKDLFWRSKGGLICRQFAFEGVLPFLYGAGFDATVLRDWYTDSIPQLQLGEIIRTFYVVKAVRRE